MNLKKLIKSNWLLLVILALGLFLRAYGAKALFLYSHDQDLAGWIIKDIVVNGHLRLIGQETSTQGVFIGGAFYYLLIPFYFLFNMDPIGGVVLVTLLGLLGIASFYLVFSRVFTQKVGLIAAFLYSVSFYTVFNDREVVPTMPVMLWSVWFFYAVYLLVSGKQRLGFLLSGVLVGLIWYLNLALAILIPLIPIALFISKSKLNFRAAALGIMTALLALTSLFVFEYRHGFQQTKAVLSSLTVGQGEFAGGAAKLDRALTLISKNVTGLLWGTFLGIPERTAFYLLLGVLVFVLVKRVVPKNLGLVMVVWLLAYIVFFSTNSIILSEYYFNGMNVVWIGALSVFGGYLLGSRRHRKTALVIISVFLAINLYRFFSLDVNRSGYIERKQVVSLIKEDASAHGYPCVAVSYITQPGYNLGYRYLFWLEDMHVNNPNSLSPVYTIVFPHSLVERIDKSFGALGLVLPDYERYDPEGVEESCSGANSNVTDPMFGYTQ